MSNFPNEAFCSRQRQLLLTGALILSLTFPTSVYGQQSPGLDLWDTSITSQSDWLREKILFRLKTKPTGRVLVTAKSNHPNLRVSLGPWIFAPDNWNSRQPMLLEWDRDKDLDTDTAIASLFASGGGYDGISEDITVTISDPDFLVLDLEGFGPIYDLESGSFTVKLFAPPL
ncbi:MAG: hypothetical protein ISN29_11240 [Gammaproteobacteria bacterium AqS3]|nr:hypothetical protein [Gammaproteobacteria bacterium AqS3]